MSIIIFITAVYNSAKRHSDVADEVLSNGKVELDEVWRVCQVPGTLDFLF